MAASWKDLQKSTNASNALRYRAAPPPSVMDAYEVMPYSPPEPQLEEPLGGPTVDPWGLISIDPTDYLGPKSLAKAGLAAGALAGSIKSVGKKQIMQPPPLKYDPTSSQSLIPGLSPVSANALRDHRIGRYDRAVENASFDADQAHYEFTPRHGPGSARANSGWRVRPKDTGGNNDRQDYNMPFHGDMNVDPNQVAPFPNFADVHNPTPGAGWPFSTTRTTMPVEAMSAALGTGNARQKQIAAVETLQKKQDAINALERPVNAEAAAESEQLVRALRGNRSQYASPADAYRLEREIAAAKRSTPVITPDADYIQQSTPGYFVNLADPGQTVRRISEFGDPAVQEQLREAAGRYDTQLARVADARDMRMYFEEAKAGSPDAPIDPPQWADELTQLPSGGASFADRPWWNKQLGVKAAEPFTGDPNQMDINTVEHFYNALRDNPAGFAYGTRAQHQGARSLEDMADSFSKTSGQRINVTRKGGEPDYDYDPEFEYVTHGRGEQMKNSRGEYKEEQLYHDQGDYPMYDQYGEKKTVELAGVKPTGEPLLPVPRKAESGDIKRDEDGNEVFEYEMSRGGEIKRDRYGDPIIDEDSYVYPDSGDSGDVELSVPGKGRLDISGYDTDDEMHVGAMGGGKGQGSGELLYQVLMSDALRKGQDIGGTNLTGINQHRLLANANSNYARWGGNPRDMRGTLNSSMTPEMREDLDTNWFNDVAGPQMWRAETAMTKARLGKDANRVLFDGEQFSIDGNPAHVDDIKANIKELSPLVGTTGVGQKSIMRAAVFDWLRGATPEEATRAGENWGKIGSPLFGKATPEFLATVAAMGAGGAALAKALNTEKE